MKFIEFLRTLREDGWERTRTTGSHNHFEPPQKPGAVTVAGHPNDDIPKGTLKSMLRQAGLEDR